MDEHLSTVSKSEFRNAADEQRRSKPREHAAGNAGDGEHRQIAEELLCLQYEHRHQDLSGIVRNAARYADAHGGKPVDPAQQRHDRETEHRARKRIEHRADAAEQKAYKHDAHKRERRRLLPAEAEEREYNGDICQTHFNAGNADRRQQRLHIREDHRHGGQHGKQDKPFRLFHISSPDQYRLKPHPRCGSPFCSGDTRSYRPRTARLSPGRRSRPDSLPPSRRQCRRI